MLSLTKGRETIMSAVLKGPFGQVDLGPTPLTIGRTPGNQLVLAEPKVSSHHAEIRPQGQDYAIVDLGSTNGTFVNDQRLASNVPSMLRTGDTIVIGDTRITYEVPGSAGTEPTVFAGSRQGSGPSYTPTVAAPFPPNTGYGADAQQPGAYQPPPPPPAGYEQASYPPSSPYYGTPVAGYGEGAQPGAYQSPPPVAPGYGPSGYAQAASYPGAPAPAAPPTQRPNRRRLWTILGAVLGVVVIALIIFGVIGYVNRSTPTKTLNAFCTALKGADYQTAYNQLSSGLQSKVGSEGVFAAGYASNGGLGKITNCTVTTVNDGAGTGTINYSLANGVSLVADYTLVNENGTWKIKSEQVRSTPTLTLNTFCNSLKTGDYQTAYNQLSAREQSLGTEAQFAASLTSNMVTACTVSNVNDTAGTGTVSYTFADGATSIIDYTLIMENGTWKIDSGKQRA